MKVLLDTNIIIHREAATVVNNDIGQLFKWLDRLGYVKCIHPITIKELQSHKDPKTVKTINVKLESYEILKTIATICEEIELISKKYDKNQNDINDSHLLNELLSNRVDFFISEDTNVYVKATELGINDRVYDIETFLEKVLYENPALIDYNVLSVRKELFGNIDLKDDFFNSLREDYSDFEDWFNRKADEPAYVFRYKDRIGAFLYLKIEDENENHSSIQPSFPRAKRLKIGTLKVALTGLKIGERLLKIVFDNALVQKVPEVYVTIYDKRPQQNRLIRLLEDFGFERWGGKKQGDQTELVLVRKMGNALKSLPSKTFPFISREADVYFCSIYQNYHTELFPDSILRTESKEDFIENQPHRNAIRKVYISHAYKRDLNPGDVIVFYRTGGIHKGVLTTIAIVESVKLDLRSETELIDYCKRKTVLEENALKEFWNRFDTLKPFVINFLYAYSFPKRPILAKIIDLGIIKSPTEIPRGIWELGWDNFGKILKEAESDENIIGN